MSNEKSNEETMAAIFQSLSIKSQLLLLSHAGTASAAEKGAIEQAQTAEPTKEAI